MAIGSLMKEYVRRQLRYWVEDFTDDLLPRDFMAKSFSRTQLLLPDIRLKPHRIAAILHLPSPLLVTEAHCSELTIAVPSWTNSDKKEPTRPVLIHMNELLLQVRNVWECSSKVRQAAEARVQAALLEPDPLGSTAAMLEFARDVVERTKLVVDKLSVQVFVGGISRLELVLVDLHARTTDALWQDVGDPTTCVDYSPDNLVQTRFKCVSFTLSVGVNSADAGTTGVTTHQTIRVVNNVTVVVQVTRFYRRQELEDSWRRHLQLVDVNVGVMKMEFGVADLLALYGVLSTFCNWFLNGGSSESDGLSASVDGMTADREPVALHHQHSVNDAAQTDQASIELQITLRGTIEAKMKFESATEGPQEIFCVADRAAGNIIIHRHGMRELQMSLHELSVRFRGYVVVRLKPDREVFHLKQRRHSIFVKWRAQSIFCRIDDDFMMILAEVHKFINEKEQPIVLRCGTCHQQISLEMIDIHVCPPRHCKSLPSTPSAFQSMRRRNSFFEGSSGESTGLDSDETTSKIETISGYPNIHVVLHMDELEVQTGGRLIHIMLQAFGINDVKTVAGRDTTTKVSNLRLTTESIEFEGDSIFVPALPLAFQMLECALQGCGCILERKRTIHPIQSVSTVNRSYRWPARLFFDIASCSIAAEDCFVKIETIQVRSSFSDGSRICPSSQPQVSFHVSMNRMRCQLDKVTFQLTRSVFDRIGGYLSGPKGSSTLALFLGVLQIRVIEFTVQDHDSTEARAKSLLKQAIIVFDNQLGYLCTHSSLNFKTILNSQLMRFVHRSSPAPRINPGPPVTQHDAELGSNPKMQNRSELIRESDEMPLENAIKLADTELTEQNTINQEGPPSADSVTTATIEIPEDQEICTGSADSNDVVTPRHKLNLEREDACRCIQQMVRRRQLVWQHEQRFIVDDYEPGVIQPVQTRVQAPAGIHLKNIVNGNASPLNQRRISIGFQSPITILGGDNDLVRDIRGGLTKLMSPLNRTLLPAESIRGGFNKLMAPINRTLSPTENPRRKQSVESLVPVVEVDCCSTTRTEVQILNDLVSSPQKSQEVRQGELEHQQNGSSLLNQQRPEDSPKAVDVTSSQDNDQKTSSSFCEQTGVLQKNGLSKAKLAALPDVVRVLVQVNECRLCIPINPREKVEFLCQEIVRRFNESFATDRGSISIVSLQDKHGGVFSPSDTVGFVLSVAPSELLFAYPREHDGLVRSLARLATGTMRNSHSRALRETVSSQNVGENDDVRPMQYSKLPLPLVIALLANESERELIRSGICERNGGSEGEEWPDLALNAASLDAEMNPLLVEVAWHETCIEITNGDAFALCRQMLGLCTSREPNKYVGKILRGRLKVDQSNPLVEWACRRKQVTDSGAHNDAAQSSGQEVHMSYQELKKVVQDSFGMYSR